MSLFQRGFLAGCLALLTGQPGWAQLPEPPARPADGDQTPRTDRYGDPLPKGAIARLGSICFRQRAQDFDASIAFAPDGRAIAMTFSDEAGCGVRLLDVPTGKVLRAFDVPGRAELREVIFSPDGTLLAGRTNHEVFLWETAVGKYPLRALRHQDEVHCFTILPDERTLVTGCGQRPGGAGCAIRFWELNSGKEVRQLERHASPVERLVVSADGKQLLSCSYDFTPLGDAQARPIPGTVCLWKLSGAELLRQQETRARWALLSPSGRLCVSQAEAKIHRVLDREADRELFRVEGEAVWCAFSPDESTLAVTQQFQDMRLLDAATGKLLRCFPGSACLGYSQASFTPDGKRLATCNSESNGHAVVKLWDATTGEELRQVGGHADAVTCVALSPDGKMALSGSRDQTVRVWGVRDGKELCAYAGHKDAIRALATSPDGRVAASVDRTGAVHLLRVGTGDAFQRFHCNGQARYGEEGCALAFTCDGKAPLVGTTAGSVGAFEVSTGRRLRGIERDDLPSLGVAFTAGGEVAATTGFVGADPFRRAAVSVWGFSTGQAVNRIQAEREEEVFGPSVFSPDGKLLAAGKCLSTSYRSACHQVCVWEVATLTEVLHIDVPHPIGALAFAPDGGVLVGSYDSWRGTDPALHVWELSTGLELGRVAGHLSQIQALAFSQDGKILVSGSADSTLLVWDTASLPGNGGRPGRGPSPGDLSIYWEKMNSDDAAAAYRAMGALVRLPDQTVALLREQIAPVGPVERDNIGRLIAALDSDSLSEREKATAELEGMAELAAPALRKAEANTSSAEVRRRAGQLLEALGRPVLSGHRLRAVRVTALLERIRTPDARKLLSDFAQGAPEARLTQEAKASLERLARRPAAPP